MVPDFFLPNLTSLSMRHNALVDVKEIGMMYNLRYLDISFNCLNKDNLINLKELNNLKSLNLIENHGMNQLDKMAVLDVIPWISELNNEIVCECEKQQAILNHANLWLLFYYLI